jgi:hypothetical protein
MYLGPGRETPSQDVSRAHVAAARNNGCSVGAYWWGYAEYDPVESVRRAVDLTKELVPECKVLWLDHERYPPRGDPWTIPGEAWLRAAAAECSRLGVPAGLYTSAYMMGLAGWPMVADVFPYLWNANYDLPPDDLSAGYGGWNTAVAHQWTSTPCDQSRILSSVC